VSDKIKEKKVNSVLTLGGRKCRWRGGKGGVCNTQKKMGLGGGGVGKVWGHQKTSKEKTQGDRVGDGRWRSI